MPYHNLTANLTPDDVQAIKNALATIREKLPFLIALTKTERRRIFKMGDKSLSFVENSLVAAQNNPNILPASFSVPEFEKDVRLSVALNDIAASVNQLASEVDDTMMAVRSEAIAASTEVYDYVKRAAKKTPGLKPVAEQLSARFARKSGTKRPALPAGGE